MKNISAKSLALTSLLLASHFASASVALLQDNRSVTNSWEGTVVETSTPSTPFSHWVQTFHYQDSQMTTQEMQGSGVGFAYSDMTGTTVNKSVFDVQFAVNDAQTLYLSATLGTSGYAPCNCAEAGFRLSGPDGFSTITGLAQNQLSAAQGSADYYGSPSLTITEEISLNPGTYRIEFWTYNDGQNGWETGSNWSFHAGFGEVPIPAAGWMMMSALGSLGAARKLRQRKK